MKYLLNHTPTASHRVEFCEGYVMLTEQIQFKLTNEIVWFLQRVKDDKTVRHTYTDDMWNLEYEPPPAGVNLVQLHCFTITYRKNGQRITMGYSTAWKLLHALTGNTERLVKDDE